MAQLPKGLAQKDIDRYAQLDAGLKRIADEHKTLNEKIKQAHEAAGLTGKHTLIYPSEKYGAVIVELSEANGVDTEALEEKYPQEKNPDYYTPKLDQKKIPADIVKKFRTVKTQRLSIKTGA
ncbi:hypothetical protein SEA_MAGRITTE_250 [Microbacterium phage Magritte]|nr:hypothetical protein SEA_MAGRITTE_250 [Microbacterium phage Magritte]